MTTTQRYDHLIHGEWVAGARYAPNINPSDTSDVLGDYAQAEAYYRDCSAGPRLAAGPGPGLHPHPPGGA